MDEAVDGETAGIAFLFDDKEERRAASVGPFEEQRGVELAEALAQALLQLLLADRGDADIRRKVGGLGLGEEGEGLARVVEDEVLEVLVVAHGGDASVEDPIAP